MKRYRKGICSEKLSLGTLAAVTGIKQDFDETVDEETLVSSIEGSYSMEDFTQGNSIGPIVVGIAHSDYSQAEIESWYEQTASWSVADLVGQEVANRKIRLIGTFPSAGASLAATALNDGVPIKTKLNWRLATGQTLSLWCYNMGSAAVASTDPSVHFSGHANLFGV